MSTPVPGGIRRSASAGASRRYVADMVVDAAERPRSTVVEASRLLGLSDQCAGVVEGGRIADTRQEQLGPVVVDDRPGPGTVAGGELGQVLPHGDELDPMAGRRRGQHVELGQRSHVGRLVEDDEQRRIERSAPACHAVVGRLQDPGDETGEQRSEPALLVSRGAEIQRVAARRAA